MLVANPFGQNAFTKGEKSKVVVRKGETFRLRFGVLVRSGKQPGNAPDPRLPTGLPPADRARRIAGGSSGTMAGRPIRNLEGTVP